MTQSAAAPPPPAVAEQLPAPRTSQRFWPAPTGKPVGAGVADTPRLLNRLQIAGMATVLLFGLLSGLVQFLSYQSDGRAADDTEQLVRIQEIQSNLLELDAIATNLVLIGGEGDHAREAQYDAALTDVLEQIAAAADAQSADEKALAALNVQVNDYATAIAQARANIRQGFPIGKEYVSEASQALRDDSVPILTNLVDANTQRAEDSMAGQHPFYLLLIGIVALTVLVWISMMLARRFRRYLNVGVAVAMAIVALVTLVAAIAAWRGDNQNDDLLNKQLKVAVDQAAARTAGNDAKANESLRLLNRGSGAKYEDPWIAAAKVVTSKAADSILDDWRTYADIHAKIVDNDERDIRQPAIRSATGESTTAFDAFDKAAQKLVDDNGRTTTDELRAGRGIALIGSLLTLVLGFVAAVAIARGIGARRKEYA
ncbi:hypothetical protein [Nocardioides sp. MH1]|uniref:hypothetical protein n=1 Tax=Nocardioides sp. MH1 TaxID=3242490 RepID=UPI00352126D5